MLRELKFKQLYRSQIDNIDEEFIIPALKNSIVYDRGAGFFSLSVLSHLAVGIIPFFRNGGNIRLITSVELSEADQEVIQNGLEKAEKIIQSRLLKQLEEKLTQTEDLLNLDLITNLLAAGRLTIKIAYLKNGGIYHEKIGYFMDSEGDEIYFNGSTNETYFAYEKNVESIIVIKSWTDESNTIESEKKYFNSLWEETNESICVVDFPEAIKRQLFCDYKVSANVEDAITRIQNESKEGNEIKSKNLYPYQQEAIDKFFENDCCYFYSMATGTGKTFTAIKTIKEFLNRKIKDRIFVVIIVPQIDLQIQWFEALKEEGINSYLFGGIGNGNDWESELDKSIIDYFEDNQLVVLISTYETYFQKLNKRLESKKLDVFIIADEAHEISYNQISAISQNIKYRLGLSATPERHNKYETDLILSYFTAGKNDVYNYSIEQAINNDFLSHYEYNPIFINLTDDEYVAYQNYTKQIVTLMNIPDRDEKQLQDIRNNRSLILKKAQDKIRMLKEMVISKKYDFKNSVVYCGQGKDQQTEDRIIDIVSSILAIAGGYRVSQFTCNTENRALVIKEFEKSYYDTLVAIKCFDQGVDVPKLDKIYILASDSLMRQTIQRRGRVLRKCIESGKNLAYIYDMFVLPPLGVLSGLGVSSLLKAELKRSYEYGRLANNSDEIEQKLTFLKNKYNIVELDADENEEY